MAKKFTEEFQIDIEQYPSMSVNDYETFKNKKLLEELRNKIIQNLIDVLSNIEEDYPKNLKVIINNNNQN